MSSCHRIIYLHHKDARLVKPVTVAKKESGGLGHYISGFDASDTVLEETVENSAVTGLRIIEINQHMIPAEFFQDYFTIFKLEVGCPVSITWLFQHLHLMPYLKYVRIGKQAFHPSMNTESAEIKGSLINSVQRFEVQYDVGIYEKLDDDGRSRMNVKIGQAILLGRDRFRNLTACTLTVPASLESILDEFISEFPALKSRSEKRIRFSDKSIIFTADASKAMRRDDGNPAGPGGIEAPPRAAQRENRKRDIPSEPTSTRSQVEVLTIDDDDDDDPIPIKVFSEARVLFEDLPDPRRPPAPRNPQGQFHN